MKLTLRLGLVVGALALSAAPALAVPTDPGGEHSPGTPGPNASLPEKAHAYGKYCADQSREQVEGERGTPFSKCVTAMAKLANGRADNPRQACEAESKKRVEGEKGTPFSRCVKGAAQLLKDEGDGSGETVV